MNPLELIALSILICVSAFLSSSETALFSLSRFQIRTLKERFKSTHRKIKRLLGDPGGLLITILVLNELVNISISTLMAAAISRSWINEPVGWVRRTHAWVWPTSPEWMFEMLLGVMITTPIVLILCDATPKVIAARANQLIAVLTAGPMTWVYGGFKPVRIVLKRIMHFVSRAIGRASPDLDPETHDQALKEEEFLFMVEEGHREGAIQGMELELIRRVFHLDDTKVSEVLTPLSQVHSIAESTTIRSALQSLKSGVKFSRIPVHAGSRRQLTGILHTKDLLLARIDGIDPEASVVDLVRRPIVVPPETRLNVLFRKLKQSRMHLAIVEDAHGATVGVVTMTDILDALFEEVL